MVQSNTSCGPVELIFDWLIPCIKQSVKERERERATSLAAAASTGTLFDENTKRKFLKKKINFFNFSLILKQVAGNCLEERFPYR